MLKLKVPAPQGKQHGNNYHKDVSRYRNLLKQG